MWYFLSEYFLIYLREHEISGIRERSRGQKLVYYTNQWQGFPPCLLKTHKPWLGVFTFSILFNLIQNLKKITQIHFYFVSKFCYVEVYYILGLSSLTYVSLVFIAYCSKFGNYLDLKMEHDIFLSLSF